MWALDIRAARPSVIAAVGAPDGVLVTPCQLAEAAWAELNRGPEERFTEITVPTEFPERRKRRSLLMWSLTLTTGATIPMFGALALRAVNPTRAVWTSPWVGYCRVIVPLTAEAWRTLWRTYTRQA